MATGATVVTITHTDEVVIDTSDKNKTVAAVRNILEGIAAGSRAGSLDVKQNGGTGVAASGVITCAGVQAADTVTINGVVLTAVAGAAGANQFSVDGDDSADATALAAAINNSASALLNAQVSAAAVGAAVTITKRVKGACGNTDTIATSNGARLAITGGGARLTGGVDAAAALLTF